MKWIISILMLWSSAFGLDIGLLWLNNPPEEQVQSYYIYQSTNVLGPYTVVTNSFTNSIRVIIPSAGQYFFFLTASNLWGESIPSDTNGTPKVGSKVLNLKAVR